MFDPRAGADPTLKIAGATKKISGGRIFWGENDLFFTVGGEKDGREVKLWDMKNTTDPLKVLKLENGAGSIMPFYDSDTKMLFLAAKGEATVKYYEYDESSADKLCYLNATPPAPESQKGVCFQPKRAMNVSNNEVMRGFQATPGKVLPLPFVVPRKSDSFQSDLFPDCIGDVCDV